MFVKFEFECPKNNLIYVLCEKKFWFGLKNMVEPLQKYFPIVIAKQSLWLGGKSKGYSELTGEPRVLGYMCVFGNINML